MSVRIGSLITWALLGLSPALGAPPKQQPHIEIHETSRPLFATFLNRKHPGNRLGYRMQEHAAFDAGRMPGSNRDADIDPSRDARLKRMMSERPGLRTFEVPNPDGILPGQQWTFQMAPAEDGIDLLWTAEAGRDGLPECYIVQQCFRLGGRSNEQWRREIAETPAFSEYDLWQGPEKDRPRRTGLTCVVRGGRWEPLPPVDEPVAVRTPAGVNMDWRLTGDYFERMETWGPYDARLLEPADCGLIARRSVDGKWVTALYWERTTHLTVHHPADCLHAGVNIGGIPGGGRRTMRGKIYWFEGSLDDLLAHWHRDFDEPASRPATRPAGAAASRPAP